MNTHIKGCFLLLTILPVLLTTGCATSHGAKDLSDVEKQRIEFTMLRLEIEIVMQLLEKLETEVASGKKLSKMPYGTEEQSVELQRINRKLLEMRLQLQRMEKEFRQRYQVSIDRC